MLYFKAKAMLREFPFLAEIIGGRVKSNSDWRWCDSITVQRVGRDILGMTPHTEEYSGSCVGVRECQEVAFVFGDRVIKNAVQPDLFWHSNYAHEGRGSEPGQSVLESLAGYEETPDFIVLMESGYVIENHYSRPNFRVVVYRPKTGTTIDDAIAAVQSDAAASVAAEIALTDE